MQYSTEIVCTVSSAETEKRRCYACLPIHTLLIGARRPSVTNVSIRTLKVSNVDQAERYQRLSKYIPRISARPRGLR